MRYIKKNITFTTAIAYKVDMDTLTVIPCGKLTFPGGLGERLAISRARKAYGKDVTVKIETYNRTYVMPIDTFIDHATPLEVNEDSENSKDSEE